MAQYEKRILNALLDAYENSVLSRGENKIAVHITVAFTRKFIPEYYDESSLAYEEIHACARQLEYKNYVKILWKKGKENHIIQKIQLEEMRVQEVYSYLNRTPIAEWEAKNLQMLEQSEEIYQTKAVSAFISYLIERIRKGESVKEYIELSDVQKTRELLKVLSAIENNHEECFIREFSIRCLGDTKRFQSMQGVIGKIMRQFVERFSEMDIYAILAEYQIYHTPNYVYLKGTGALMIGKRPQEKIDLKNLHQGIGLAGEDLWDVKVAGYSEIKRIITIENLTTFFRWKEEEGLVVYLGGYHNSVRRHFLQRLYEQMPDAEYLHFGDIDVGGFEIYEDLCRKTGIVFRPYYMGVEELKKYCHYTKKLTSNDRKRLQMLADKKKTEDCTYMDVLEYMLEHGVKLEQECVEKIQKQ